jgi:hypothetical protein
MRLFVASVPNTNISKNHGGSYLLVSNHSCLEENLKIPLDGPMDLLHLTYQYRRWSSFLHSRKDLEHINCLFRYLELLTLDKVKPY